MEGYFRAVKIMSSYSSGGGKTARSNMRGTVLWRNSRERMQTYATTSSCPFNTERESERKLVRFCFSLFLTLRSIMASSSDIARYLTLGSADSSALAEVITDYFADRESDHGIDSDDDFLPTGMHTIVCCMTLEHNYNNSVNTNSHAL